LRQRIGRLLAAHVEVALDPGLRGAQVLAVPGLVAREERKARVEQAQAQVLAQEIGLRRRQQRRLGGTDLAHHDELLHLAPDLGAQARPESLVLGVLGSGRALAALVECERQRIHAGHEAVDAGAHRGDVEHRKRLEPLDVARQRAPHGNELRPVGFRQASLGELQREQRGAHVAGELQLLRSDGEDLLDLGELPFVAVARQLLVQRFQRELLALRFGEARFELRHLELRVAHAVLRLARDRARLARVVLDVAQPSGELFLRRADAVARVEPVERGERGGERDRDEEKDRRAGTGLSFSHGSESMPPGRRASPHPRALRSRLP